MPMRHFMRNDTRESAERFINARTMPAEIGDPRPIAGDSVAALKRKGIVGIYRTGWDFDDAEKLVPIPKGNTQSREIEHDPVERAFNEIDAAVYSSDYFLDPETLERLKFFVGRWSRAIPDLAERMAEAQEDEEGEPQ